MEIYAIKPNKCLAQIEKRIEYTETQHIVPAAGQSLTFIQNFGVEVLAVSGILVDAKNASTQEKYPHAIVRAVYPSDGLGNPQAAQCLYATVVVELPEASTLTDVTLMIGALTIS